MSAKAVVPLTTSGAQIKIVTVKKKAPVKTKEKKDTPKKKVTKAATKEKEGKPKAKTNEKTIKANIGEHLLLDELIVRRGQTVTIVDGGGYLTIKKILVKTGGTLVDQTKGSVRVKIEVIEREPGSTLASKA